MKETTTAPILLELKYRSSTQLQIDQRIENEIIESVRKKYNLTDVSLLDAAIVQWKEWKLRN